MQVENIFKINISVRVNKITNCYRGQIRSSFQPLEGIETLVKNHNHLIFFLECIALNPSDFNNLMDF